MRFIRLRPIRSSIVGLSVAVVVAAAFAVSALGPALDRLSPAPLTIASPITVGTPRLHAGDTLVLITSHCVMGTEPLIVDYARNYVSVNDDTPDLVGLPRVSAVLPAGCETVTTHTNMVPRDLPPGMYVLQGIATARGHNVPFATQPFLVEAP